MPKHKEEHSELEKSVAQVERIITFVRWMAVVLVALGLLVGVGAALKFPKDTNSLGSLGGFLQGTMGALWGLAGLTLVYVAFLGQQLQIIHQKEDLRLTREAFMEQRKEMQTQTELFDNQRFETTFFALLSAHLDLVNNIEVDTGKGPKRGPLAFEAVLARITEHHTAARLADPVTPSLELSKRVFMEHYREFEQVLGPYFHSLFHIIKFVDERPLPVERQFEQRRYVNYVRARLSVSELVILFYSGIGEQAAGMRAMIERYALLKHLSTTRLLDREHRLIYKATAWARPMSQQSSDMTNEHRARKRGRLHGKYDLLPAGETMGGAGSTMTQTIGGTLSDVPNPTEELGRQAPPEI